MFTCFIKSAFHEALVMKLSSGAKTQLKTIKKIIKNVFDFCNANKKENPLFGEYITDFIRYDVI